MNATMPRQKDTDDGVIDEEDDEESQISELMELAQKTGMKPMAKKSDRFLQLGMRNELKKKNTLKNDTSSVLTVFSQ